MVLEAPTLPLSEHVIIISVLVVEVPLATAIVLLVEVLVNPDGDETPVTVRPESQLIFAEKLVKPSEAETITENLTVDPLCADEVPLIDTLGEKAEAVLTNENNVNKTVKTSINAKDFLKCIIPSVKM